MRKKEKAGVGAPASKSSNSSAIVSQKSEGAPEPIVPVWWWSAIQTSPTYRFNAIGVAMLIAKHRDHKTNELRNWSQAALGKHLSLNVKRVAEAISLLQGAGILHVRLMGPRPPVFTLNYKAPTATGRASTESSDSGRQNALTAAGQKLSQPLGDTTPSYTPSYTPSIGDVAKNEKSGISLVADALATARLDIGQRPESIVRQIGETNASRFCKWLSWAVANKKANPIGYAISMSKENADPPRVKAAPQLRSIYRCFDCGELNVDCACVRGEVA